MNSIYIKCISITERNQCSQFYNCYLCRRRCRHCRLIGCLKAGMRKELVRTRVKQIRNSPPQRDPLISFLKSSHHHFPSNYNDTYNNNSTVLNNVKYSQSSENHIHHSYSSYIHSPQLKVKQSIVDDENHSGIRNSMQRMNLNNLQRRTSSGSSDLTYSNSSYSHSETPQTRAAHSYTKETEQDEITEIGTSPIEYPLKIVQTYLLNPKEEFFLDSITSFWR